MSAEAKRKKLVIQNEGKNAEEKNGMCHRTLSTHCVQFYEQESEGNKEKQAVNCHDIIMNNFFSLLLRQCF